MMENGRDFFKLPHGLSVLTNTHGVTSHAGEKVLKITDKDFAAKKDVLVIVVVVAAAQIHTESK